MAGVTDEWLLHEVAENHRELFRRGASARRAAVVAVGGSELFLGPEAMIFPQPALDVDALMTEIRARGCAGVGCWSLTADASLGTRLVARGFGWGWRPHWMAIDLRTGMQDEPTARFTVEPAAPPYARTLPYAPHGPEPSGCVRLGVRLREKVIGQVLVNPGAKVAGIYAMGVAPRVRRRGIATALTHAACRVALQRGCDHVILNATEAGEPVYRQVGFRSLGWGQTWWYVRGTAPPARRVALTEAVGFGDLAALDALAPSCAELNAALSGDESALRFSVLTGQPAAAAWVLARCPELAARRYEPHGVTLLHLAAEHDLPALVELALAHGVDPAARDATFSGTAADWARHFGRDAIAQRLDQLARPDSGS